MRVLLLAGVVAGLVSPGAATPAAMEQRLRASSLVGFDEYMHARVAMRADVVVCAGVGRGRRFRRFRCVVTDTRQNLREQVTTVVTRTRGERVVAFRWRFS